MGQWNKLIKSGSNAELNNLYVGNAVTASYFSGNGAGLTDIPVPTLQQVTSAGSGSSDAISVYTLTLIDDGAITLSSLGGFAFESSNNAGNFARIIQGLLTTPRNYTLPDASGTIKLDDGSYSGSFSGSFSGDGSQLTGIATSSYALTASYFSGQNYATFTQSTPATSWTFTHNLNNLYPVITVYDSGSRVTVPSEIYPSNANTTIINFPTSQSGYASATVGSVISSAGISYLTGSCTFSFGFTGSFEGDFAETTINTVGLSSDNFRSFSYLPVTSSHHELDDFFVEGLDFKIQVINSNSTTGLVAFARENTWGDYTIKYNITYS